MKFYVEIISHFLKVNLPPLMGMYDPVWLGVWGGGLEVGMTKMGSLRCGGF